MKKDINIVIWEIIADLENTSKSRGKSLKGITKENYLEFLDQTFSDGGIVSEMFSRHAEDYSSQFGPEGSQEYNEVYEEVIDKVLSIFEAKYNKR